MIFINNFIRFLKKKIKKSRTLFWSIFHPDNIFVFKYANHAEKIAWKFLEKEFCDYESFCEIGCFNGRITFVLKKFFHNKNYIGYDLNFFAIITAKVFNYFFLRNNNSFYCQNGISSAKRNYEVFVSIATIIYFSEKELKEFIRLLRKNKSFKALVIHEIFLNENLAKKKSSLKDENLYLHSISMIKYLFGKNYNYEILRTYYPNWERDDRFSAILTVRRN